VVETKSPKDNRTLVWRRRDDLVPSMLPALGPTFVILFSCRDWKLTDYFGQAPLPMGASPAGDVRRRWY
jgi:hypothetical protein